METNRSWPGKGTDHLSTSPVTQSERMYCDAKYKRLERGTFPIPKHFGTNEGVELDYAQLVQLLSGLDLRTGRRRRRYRRAG